MTPTSSALCVLLAAAAVQAASVPHDVMTVFEPLVRRDSELVDMTRHYSARAGWNNTKVLVSVAAGLQDYAYA